MPKRHKYASSPVITTKYDICQQNAPSMKIALITDLHEYDPEYVLPVLEREKPDMICAAGDILERHILDGYEQQGEDPDEGDMSMFSRIFIRTLTKIKHSFYPDMVHPTAEFARYVNSENSYRFFREASKITQVFYSPGNHERYFTDRDRQVIRETGIVFLDNSEAAWKGIRVGGLSSTPDMDWLQEYSKRPGYKLLLCHHPEFYDKYLKDTDIDLILSGHVHGGQMRVLGKGIFSPGQGLFPKYFHGFHDNRLIVSAGTSNTVSLPRWGNPCEVVIINLTGK